MLRPLLVSIGALSVMVLGAVAFFNEWRGTPLVLGAEGVVIVVEEGDSLSRVSRRLERKGILGQRRLFNLLGRLTGADARLAQGEYRIPPGSTPDDLLEQLQRGDTLRYLVTIPEGLTLGGAIDLLASTDGISAVVSGPDDSQLLDLISPMTDAEGWFLPETYQYERGDSDLSILTEAHRLMRASLTEAWEGRHPELPLATPYELLILASVIEKETGLASERPQIGGVFIRRLQKGMRLQTDPTVIYGLGPTFDGNLTRQHLRDESNPYNSYRHHGLPPGPIALPGKAALMAAARPLDGESLYFVARGDGSHAFSATLDEHEAAVAQFQLQRRADYRSSPGTTP